MITAPNDIEAFFAATNALRSANARQGDASGETRGTSYVPVASGGPWPWPSGAYWPTLTTEGVLGGCYVSNFTVTGTISRSTSVPGFSCRNWATADFGFSIAYSDPTGALAVQPCPRQVSTIQGSAPLDHWPNLTTGALNIDFTSFQAGSGPACVADETITLRNALNYPATGTQTHSRRFVVPPSPTEGAVQVSLIFAGRSTIFPASEHSLFFRISADGSALVLLTSGYGGTQTSGSATGTIGLTWPGHAEVSFPWSWSA